MDNTARTLSYIQAKPILKWAGGKTQMLNDLLPKVPSSYGRYIEPFFGGGALFFALRPENAIIADSNPELVNMYRQVANNLDDVIDYLKKYKNTSEMFYQVRALEWTELPPAEAAARTIYLNRTCFNGLYRVNRKGQFNVPYGKYVNPKICDEENLHAVSKALQKAEIVCGDYLLVLEHYAKPGDFIFLDPPYLPISEYYERNGYFGMSHARIRRSEILLEFIKETFAGDITAGEQRNITETGKKSDHLEILDIIKESLIFDLYYRENCKSRPAWAKDLSVWKQVTRAYCKNGKQSHVECFSYRFPDKGERVLKELPKRAGKPLYALFDYTDRDPLDHQAKVTWIMEDEDAGLCSH